MSMPGIDAAVIALCPVPVTPPESRTITEARAATPSEVELPQALTQIAAISATVMRAHSLLTRNARRRRRIGDD